MAGSPIDDQIEAILAKYAYGIQSNTPMPLPSLRATC